MSGGWNTGFLGGGSSGGGGAASAVTAVGATNNFNGTQSNQSVGATYQDSSEGVASVSVVTGTSAIVTVGYSFLDGTAGFNYYVSFAISGATTLAASDTNCAFFSNNSSSGAQVGSRTVLVTGLTAGTNTFTWKIRRSSGSSSNCQIFTRDIVVWAQ